MKSAVMITFKRSSFDVRLVMSIQLLSHSRPHFRAARLSLTNLRLRRLRRNAPLLMYGGCVPVIAPLTANMLLRALIR